MVTITVINNLQADMTVDDTDVGGGGASAAVPVTGTSFTVVTTAQWAATYTVPLICDSGSSDVDNVCSYTNPQFAVWSFQAPLPNADLPTGYLIGSVDGVGAYTLVAGACQVQVIIDPSLAALVTVVATARIASGNPTLKNGDKPQTLLSSAGKVTVKFTNATSTMLDATFVTPTYAATLAAWVTKPFPAVTEVTYSNSIYAAKQVATATVTMQQTTMVIHLALPEGSNELGFQFESFHYPSLAGRKARATRGFYYQTNFTNSQFLPEAPILILDSSADFLTMQGTPPALTLRSIGSAKPGVFAFRACAPVSNPTYQLLWLTESSSNGSWYVFDSNLNLGGDMAAACAQGQWGVFQVWDSAASGYAGQVAFGYKPAAANAAIKWLNNGSFEVLNATALGNCTLNEENISVNVPIGFVSGVPANCTFLLALASSDATVPGVTSGQILYTDPIPTPYYETCWNSNPPLAALASGTGGPGAPMCASPPPGDALAAYNIGKRKFVMDTCLGETADCNGVAGIIPATCVGWIGTHTYQNCLAACQSDVGTNLSVFCDQSKIAYCEASDAHANSAECACIKVDTSSFAVPFRGGMSYPQFTNWMTATYGVTANTSLNPQCWWDTCANSAASIGMTVSNTVLSCPKVLDSCTNVVKGLTVDANSSVRLKMVNDCRISSDTKNNKPTPCASLAALAGGLTSSSSASPWATAETPGMFSIFEQALLALTGMATIIMVMCTIAAVVTKIKKSGAFE